MSLVAGIPFSEAAEPWSRYESASELRAGAIAGPEVLAGVGNRVTTGGSTALGVLALGGNANLTLAGFKVGDVLPAPRIVVGPARQAVTRSRTW